MDERGVFQLPILTIKEVKPLLQKDKRIFAYEIKAITSTGKEMVIGENKGLNLSEYVNKKMEFLLEITRGEFNFREENEEIPEYVTVFNYKWQKRPKDYFPELQKIKDDIELAVKKNEINEHELFKIAANKFCFDWGLNGLDIGISQVKPLLNSSDGIFLLNEYEFEEYIDTFELDQEVYIKIEECYLRGIRPYVPEEQRIKEASYKYYNGKYYSKEEWRQYSMNLATKKDI